MSQNANIGGKIFSPGKDGNIDTKLIGQMKRKAQTGFGVDRLAQYRWNPFTQSTNLDVPQDYTVRNQYKRYFFKTNPIVGAAIELHSEFPLSNFHLTHEDEAIEEFLNGMLDDCNFFETLLMAAMEYWLIGEFNLFGFFNDFENPACYTGFAILDPDKCTVVSNNFVQGPEKETVRLQMDPVFVKIVDQGPYHPITGKLYQNLPADMIAAAKVRQPLPLSPIQVARLKRGNYFANRGESILERIFPLCMYKDKLRAAQYIIADRHITPTEIFKIGETNDPADQEELEAFRETIAATYMDINKLIIWHHALQYEAIGTQGKIMPLWAEFDNIDNEICTGLLINKGLLMGDSSTFASDVIRYDILINRYLLFRTKLENLILKQIIRPILRIHEIYVPEYKVKSMAYREACGKGRPLAYPQIQWEKQSLRDENAKMQLMTQLVEKKLIPESALIRLLNMDPKTAAQKVEQEAEAKIERRWNLLKRLKNKGIPLTPEFAQILGVEGSGLPDQPGAPSDLPASIDTGGAPSSGGGLDEPGGKLPEVVPGASEEGATGGIPMQGDIQAKPAESNLPVGIPT